MKIAIFTDTFLPKVDGVTVSVSQFCEKLGKKGHRFLIFCPRYSRNDTRKLGNHTKIIRFRNFSLPSYPDIKVVLPSKRKIKKNLLNFNTELVHIQSPGLMGLYGISAAKKMNLPLVGSYHTMIAEQGMYLSPYRLLKIDKLITFINSRKKIKKSLDNIERKEPKKISRNIIRKLSGHFYKKTDLIISPSLKISSILKKEGIKNDIRVISNGIELKDFSMKAKKEIKKQPRLLHVGRISHEKNIEVVIKAFKEIKKELKKTTLDIIGDGPSMPELKEITRKLGLDKSVKFRGFIDRKELPKIYPKYDLFITASTMETQGLVVLEAISSGLPCVGVRAYALPELIRHGINGYCAKPFDYKKIAGYSLDILKDEKKYKNFSKAGIRIARTHKLENCAKRLEKAYKKLLKKIQHEN